MLAGRRVWYCLQRESVKSYRKELWFNVPERRALINITTQVYECLRETGIQESLCLDNVSLTMIPASLR